MRVVVGAGAAVVSRVVDDDWLQVITVVGEPSFGEVDRLRWRRSDLVSMLAHAETVGRLHATRGRAVSYAEVPESVRETERYVPSHLGLLIAPLHSSSGELLGVMTTEGPIDVAHLTTGACELVELYADQARVVLHALREQGRLTERLRVSDAAQGLLHDLARVDDVPAAIGAAVAGLRDMLRASGAWAFTVDESGESGESGEPAGAISSPPEVARRLGDDVHDLLDPVVAEALREGRAVTIVDHSVLGRLAAATDHAYAALAPIGDGSGTRGALLLLRDEEAGPWSAGDLDALHTFGRRLGAVADQVLGRRRVQDDADELMRLDEYRRDLVASITHDLKTPLTAIALNAELLQTDGRLDESDTHPVEAIRRSADRLSGLVDDLLAMARLDEGHTAAAQVEVVAMVRDACDAAETEAALRGVEFVLDTPAELWANVDHHSLARVFANLVSNAVKFSLPRGRVVLSLSRRDDQLVFQCADEGIGISSDRLGSLFDVAGRPDDVRTLELPGSGIGLAICERIVQRLGGRISVDSEQGQGSTFTVRVPC